MALIEVSQINVPHIVFNSKDWDENNDDGDVAEEIIKFLKENKHKNILIQNKAYSLGDTGIQPIVMVSKDDYGGFKGTLSTFIKDIIYDLIPED
jgi:hypothetical protein